jgi:hypothetical protein
VIVTVRATGAPLASATGRLVYDSTGLEFVSEESLSDGVTRAINPAAGQLRFAAIAPEGFADGRVHALRFKVLNTAALRGVRLVIDEAHTLTRTDVTAALMSRTP